MATQQEASAWTVALAAFQSPGGDGPTPRRNRASRAACPLPEREGAHEESILTRGEGRACQDARHDARGRPAKGRDEVHWAVHARGRLQGVACRRMREGLCVLCAWLCAVNGRDP